MSSHAPPALVPVLLPQPDVLSKLRVSHASRCGVERDAQRGAHVLVLRGDTTHARVQLPRDCRPCSLLSLRCALLSLQLRLAAVEHFALELTLRLDGAASCRLCIATHVKAASYSSSSNSDRTDSSAAVVEARLPLIVPRSRWVQVLVHVDGIVQHIFRQPPLRSIDVVALAGTARVGSVVASNDEQACIDATLPTLVLFAVPAYAPPIWRTATTATPSTSDATTDAAADATHSSHARADAAPSSPSGDASAQTSNAPSSAPPALSPSQRPTCTRSSSMSSASASSSLPSAPLPPTTTRALALPARLQPLPPPQQPQQAYAPRRATQTATSGTCTYVRFVDYAPHTHTPLPPPSSSLPPSVPRARAGDTYSSSNSRNEAAAAGDVACAGNDMGDDAVCAWRGASVRDARVATTATVTSTHDAATCDRATQRLQATQTRSGAGATASTSTRAKRMTDDKSRDGAARRARATATTTAAAAAAPPRRTASSYGRDGAVVVNNNNNNNNNNSVYSRARGTTAAVSVARGRRGRARRRLRLLRAHARQLQRAYDAAAVCASDVSLYSECLLGCRVRVDDDDEDSSHDDAAARCTSSSTCAATGAVVATTCCATWWRRHEPHCGYGFGYLGVLHDNGDYDVDTAADLRMKGALSLQLSDDDDDDADEE